MANEPELQPGLSGQPGIWNGGEGNGHAANPVLQSRMPVHPLPDRSPAVELHIDELVLHGFEHLHRAELAPAVQRALSQLFVERGVPLSLNMGGQADRLDGGSFSAQPDADMHDIAGQIAQAIYRGFEP